MSSTTDFQAQLSNYLDRCKSNLQLARLSHFVKTHEKIVYDTAPELLEAQAIMFDLKRRFMSCVKKLSLNSSTFAADIEKVDWSSIAAEKSKGLNPALPSPTDENTRGYQPHLFRYCLDFLKSGKLSKLSNAYLQVALSGIINTLSSDEEIKFENYIGLFAYGQMKTVSIVEDMHLPSDKNPEMNSVVQDITEAYRSGGITQARMTILKKKLKMLEDKEYLSACTALKIYDIFDYLFNMIQFDFADRHTHCMSENESFSRWQDILCVLFRGTPIRFRTGELVSQVTKIEKQESNGGSNTSFGRRIDMLIVTHLKEGRESVVELAGNEHKREDISCEEAYLQQNKNIQTNACILSQLEKRFKVVSDAHSPTNPVVIDAIGLRGYLYRICRIDDVFVAAKMTDHCLLLPTTLVEFEEFLDEGVIFILLKYAEHLIEAAEEIISSADLQQKRKFEAIANIQEPGSSPRFFFPSKKPKQ
ncbi:hypothetical protein DFQ30_000896 [Apophysomyces sp. BC1015]|nr:hypothetical protein DFQ30_000896 [Apophysomyces sp. BC1015]